MRRPPSLAAAVLTLALAAAAPLAACSSSDGSDGSATTEASSGGSGGPAPGRAAAALALEQERTVIDVRTPEEYAAGHIEGAQDIDLRNPSFPDQIAQLDPDGRYVVYCHSGNRSAQATQEMGQIGLDVLDGGGIGDMTDAGWPTA